MKKLIYYILNFFSHNLERKILENFKGKKKLIIFDVGCFKGVFSRKIFSLIKNRRSKFYLFDINKNTKNYISDLISLKNFNLFEVALSNKNGTAIYNHNRFFESSGSSLSNLYRTDTKWVLSRKIFLKFFFQSTKDYSRYKVKTTTLDSFVKKKGINLIDILKVDIDGSENQFLKGATKTIKNKKVKVILLEINGKKISFNQKEKKIINFFKKMQYFLVKKHINHSVSFFSNAKSGDYLFLRKN